jgi:hypothetical protein
MKESASWGTDIVATFTANYLWPNVPFTKM